MPTPSGEGTWSERPLSSTAAAIWLRRILAVQGRPPEELAEVATHCLKCTPLSWCAKRPLDLHVRQALGFLVISYRTSALTYSCDAVAAPVSAFTQLLREIREGVFCPDETWSGRLPEVARRRDAEDETLSEEGDRSAGDEVLLDEFHTESSERKVGTLGDLEPRVLFGNTVHADVVRARELSESEDDETSRTFHRGVRDESGELSITACSAATAETSSEEEAGQDWYICYRCGDEIDVENTVMFDGCLLCPDCGVADERTLEGPPPQ